MSFAAAYEGRLKELMAGAPARAPSTLGEIWSSEWAASGLDTVETMFDPYRSSLSTLQDRIKGVTGKGVAELADQFGLDTGFGRDIGSQVLAVQSVIDRLPEDQRKQLEADRDVVGNARRKAREIEQRAEEVSSSTYGLSGYATAFAAGISRQMVSPVNIALMPLGGPLKGSIPRMLAREAGYGAVGQAVQEPFIAAGREQLGLQSTSIENIAQAAIGQALFAGVFRAGAAGFRAFRDAEAMRAQGLTPETAPLAAEIEQGLATARSPFERSAPVDGAGRLVLDAAPLPDIPAGVRLDGRAPVSAPPAELRAQAQSVTFTEPTLSGPVRDVATRLAPEDFEAVALLAERNAALDVQAEALGPVLARMQDEVVWHASKSDFANFDPAKVQSPGGFWFSADKAEVEAFGAAKPYRLAVDNPGSLADLARARREVAAAPDAPDLQADAAAFNQAVIARLKSQGFDGIRDDNAKGAGGSRVRTAFDPQQITPVDISDLVSLQADAVELAARALEAGRPVPQPAAFTVRPEVNFDPVKSRAERVLRARPDLDAALQSIAKALDAGAVPDGPFARAFFADDAMTVPLPRDLAIDRITRAGERALSAEISGAPAWSLDGIAKLAERIDRPVSDLPPVKDKPPAGDAPVRTRIKGEAPARAQAAEGGSQTNDGLSRVALLEPRKTDMKTQRIINTVERELGELGDVRVELDGPDGRRITSAREMLARIADDEQALAALDACVTSGGRA
jgi:hypothetical protein